MSSVTTYTRTRERAVALEGELQQLRERARRFEFLTAEADTLRRRVESLARPRIDTKPLEEILKLVEQVPEGQFITRGSGPLPGGFEAKLVLQQIAADALADARRREKERQRTLATAKDDLDRIEKALVAESEE